MTLKCGHCGASNSDSAKFCGKCAVRLRPAAADRAKKAPAVTVAEADIATILQLDPIPIEENDAVTQFMPREVTQQLVPSFSSTVDLDDHRLARRTRLPIVFGVIAIALVGAVVAWQSTGSRRPVLAPAVANSVSLLAAPIPTAAAPILSPEPAASAMPANTALVPAYVPDRKKDHERSVKADKATVYRDGIPKHKADKQLTRKSEAAGAKHLEDANHNREAISLNDNEATVKSVRPKAKLPTPREACADRSNFISRGICESRECEKPERATLKFCVDMHERRVIHD